MPQMRAVMSGASAQRPAAQEGLEEARRLEDPQLDVLDLARRGARTCIAALALDPGEVVGLDPCACAPSALAHAAASCARSRRGTARRVGVEACGSADEVGGRRRRGRRIQAAQRRGVGRLHRPEAAVAAAVVAGQSAPQPAWVTGPEAGRAVGDHHADVAAPLALDADAVGGDRRACARRGTRRSPRAAGACRSGSPAARSRPGRGRRSASRSPSVEMYSGVA